MQLKIIYTTSIFCILLLLILDSCCRKTCVDPSNPECVNYEPCYNKKPITADFRVTANHLIALLILQLPLITMIQ
jgi:hypothetical protein